MLYSWLYKVLPKFIHNLACHKIAKINYKHSIPLLLLSTKALELDGMKELLAIAAQHSIPLQGGDLSPSIPKHPVIVVEGLDAAGTYMYVMCMYRWVHEYVCELCLLWL